MIDGHPYFTEEFDRCRATQRRQLDLVATALRTYEIKAKPAAFRKDQEPDLSGRDEAAYRAEAARLLQPQAEFLKNEEARQQAETVHRRVNHTVENSAGGWVEAAVTSIVNGYQGEDIEMSRQVEQTLRDAALLLQLADVLAEQSEDAKKGADPKADPL